MSDGMEMDPEAVQAFAVFTADMKAQIDQIKARFDKPTAAPEDFGRSWTEKGEEYVELWGKLGPDLASLSALLEQVGTQVTQGAKMVMAGDSASMGEFNKISTGSEGAEGSSADSGGN